MLLLCKALVSSSDALVTSSFLVLLANLVTTSKALVSSSDALVSTSEHCSVSKPGVVLWVRFSGRFCEAPKPSPKARGTGRIQQIETFKQTVQTIQQ